MKNRYLAVLVATACVCLASVAVDAQVNIMAMGDSVTARGNTPQSSYRYWLYTYLVKAGFTNNIAFVGNQYGVSDGTPANSWPEEAYENGGPGADAWATENGVEDAPSAAATLNNTGNPGVLLLDLGANDLNEQEPTKTNLLEVQQNLETIIQTFYNQNSGNVILLAVPTPWIPNPPNDPIARKFMAGLGSAVSKAAQDQRKMGVDVIVVNLHGGFNPRVGADTQDGTHPSVKGEQMIAKKFFNALRPVLKKMQKQGLLG